MEDSESSPRPYMLRKRRVKFCRRVSFYNLSQLPSEVLLQLFKYLPLKDLLSLRQVCTHFKWLIDCNTSLWTTATLVGEWPTAANYRHFEKAADHGNVEALLKLGVAYLYNEGTPKIESSTRETNGTKAAEYFHRAESLTPSNTFPFTWLFIRPPWSQNGSCCKAQVFNYLKNTCKDNQNASNSVLLCIAEIQRLLQEEGEESDETPQYWYRLAASHGSSYASYLLWQEQVKERPDSSTSLSSIRQLREIASQGCMVAHNHLLGAYGKGHYGGLDEQQVMKAVRSFVQSSRPTNSHNVFNVQTALTSSMRYILIDWLVEVSSTKEISRTTIHTVVHCVDRYLLSRPISRATLQLVGIAAMVLVSRLLEKDIFTIREAAWLTEGAYKYEEVVRMMGDIVATLHGQIRVPIVLDYLGVISMLVENNKKAHCLSLFISELSLLYAEFGPYPLGKIAAACVLLARLMLYSDQPWPERIAEYTGYTVADLTECVFHLYKKCFNEEPMVDHRDVILAAVKERYQDNEQEQVAKIDIISEEDLRMMLCVVEEGSMEAASLNQALLDMPHMEMEPFVLSPSRRQRSGSYSKTQEAEAEREKRVVTPTIEVEEQEIDNGFKELPAKNDSFASLGSGYEGDGESEGEMDAMDYQDMSPAKPNVVCSEATVHDEPGPSCSQQPTQRNARLSNFSIHIDAMDTNAAKNSENPNCLVKRSPRLRRVKGKSFQIDVNGKLQLQALRAPLQRVENETRPMTRRRMAGKRKSMEDQTGNGSDSMYFSL
ncbi:cyclin-F-like [Amphiura filiformis]|uniref:cyclin-F-like n=1 Tax=Amphiura filiformis TaxID=82378 RepID=UPI003B21F8F1